MSQKASGTSAGPSGLAVGNFAVDLVLAIPELCPEVEALTFMAYRPGPVLEERLKLTANTSVREILCRSQHIKRQEKIDIPLFDLVMGSRFRASDFNAVLEDILYHRPEEHIHKTWTVQRRYLTRKTIEQMRRQCGEDAGLALTSVVRVRNGKVAHLPLMDFRCSKSGGNLRKLVTLFSAARTRLPNKGCILKSQRSYHFYGFTVLTKAGWVRFLGSCLLLGPLADSRYVAHCLLHGKSSLRITESPRHNDVPTISAFVGA